MKKASILALLLLLLMTGCSNKVKVTELYQQVTIGFNMYSEEPMTKSVYTNPVQTYIENALPATLTFTLTDGDGNKTTVISGQSVSLKLGTYTVKAKYTPQTVAAVVGASLFLSNEPSLSVNTTLTITASQTSYVVGASYTCFGIVVDNDEVQSVSYQSSHGEAGNLTMNPVASNAYGIIFVNGSLDTATMDVILTAKDVSLENTTYKFYVNGNSGDVYAQYGKYYILHPKAKTGIDEGFLSYITDDWTEVEIN